MSTLNDIAKKSGFSKTLVARVINNQPGVSDESRKRILEVADELNYTPNLLAKALTTNRTNTISVVLDSLCTPFYFNLIKSIEETARKRNVKVLFCSPNDSLESKKSYTQFFSQGTSDGIIIYGSNKNDDDYILELAKRKYPVVVIESKIEHEDIHNVLINNKKGGMLATKYLMDCGCKKIYFFTGDDNKSISDERLNGYKEQMILSGLEKNIFIIEADFSVESGYEQMSNLIKNKDIPDGIFFAADNTGYGALKAIYEQDKSLLEKIKFIGFDDDVPLLNGLPLPILSTIHQPLFEIGEIATNILLDHIYLNEKERVVKVIDPILKIKST